MNTFATLSLSALVLSLLACGGSPSSDAPANSTLSTVALQGIWRSPAGAASTLFTTVLPDGKVWALIANANSTRLLKGGFEVQNNSFVGTGKIITLGTTTSSAASLSASVVEKLSLTGAITSAGSSEPFSLAYQLRYDTPATLGDFVGTWRATLGPGTVTWTIGAAGELTGTRTTGCTYSGQLSLRAEQKAVLNAVVTEDCSGVLTKLSGVALKSEDRQGISMMLTNSDDTAAVAVNLVK